MGRSRLNFSQNIFGDPGLLALAEATSLGHLQSLELSKLMMVTTEGWQAFASALKGCRSSAIAPRLSLKASKST